MKTKPVANMLPIPMKSDLQEVMTIYYEAIHEMVCYSTHILAWSLKVNKKNQSATELDLAAPLLFRHTVELLDAISIQIKNGIVEPCKVQLRAALEAYLSLDYMLQEKTQERAACFYIVDFYRKLNMYRKYSSGTPENFEFQKELEEFSTDYGDFLTFKGSEDAYVNMESIIARPIYADARKEYLAKSNQNTKKTDIKWYSLFNGPNSVSWLAKRLKKYEFYEFFYKPWSNPSHGTELWSGSLARGSEEGYGSIKQIRNMELAQDITEMTITLGLMSFGLIGEKLVPKEKVNIGKWTMQFSSSHYAKVERSRPVFRELT